MIREARETEGSLASAIQKRHKIRHTDLDAIFEAANKLDADKYSRIYMIFQLMLYAGAAYRNFKELIAAPANGLGNVYVLPHWDITNTYKITTAYPYEPMNLFPGWSLTNLRNNQVMLDPHRVILYPSNIMATDLCGVDQSANPSTPQGLKTASILNPKDGQATRKKLNDDNPSTRPRSNTAYTQSLELIENTLELRLANIRKSLVHTKTLEVKNKFQKLRTELQSTTDAGVQHYQALIESITNNLNSQHPAIASINSAQKNWQIHRAKMIEYINECLSDINGFDKDDVVSMPQGPH
jgi:hypothetical protein